jgi:hypothetical protein
MQFADRGQRECESSAGLTVPSAVGLKIVESSLLDFLVSSLWRFLLLTAPSIPLMTHTPFDLPLVCVRSCWAANRIQGD